MIQYQTDDKPLDTLISLFGDAECYGVVKPSHHEKERLVSGEEEPAMQGHIVFKDFLCNWSFRNEATIYKTNPRQFSVRSNVLDLLINHPDRQNSLYAWVICEDSGDAFRKLEKLAYLAGKPADLS